MALKEKGQYAKEIPCNMNAIKAQSHKKHLAALFHARR